MAEKRWVYLIRENWGNAWNELGAEGWEMVAVTIGSDGIEVGYFKREVKDG